VTPVSRNVATAPGAQWAAKTDNPLYVLQRVAGHQDPAVTARYLHPDTAALVGAGTAFSVWWGRTGAKSRT
jgi:hypothetical protein